MSNNLVGKMTLGEATHWFLLVTRLLMLFVFLIIIFLFSDECGNNTHTPVRCALKVCLNAGV